MIGRGFPPRSGSRGAQDPELLKELLDVEGELRVAMGKALSMTFLVDDEDKVVKNLTSLVEVNKALYQTLENRVGSLRRDSLSAGFGVPKLKKDEVEWLEGQVQVFAMASFAVDWLQLTVLDHLHTLRKDDKSARLTDAELESYGLGFSIELMAEDYFKIPNPSPFEQQAFLQLVKIAGRSVDELEERLRNE